MKQFSLLLTLCLTYGLSTQAQTALESGNIAYGARNFKQAISYYERAITDNPGNLKLNLQLAHSYRFVNDMVNAEKKYQQACLNPDIPSINHYYYGTVLKANKKYAEAKTAFSKFGESNPVLAKMAEASCDFVKANINSPSAFDVKINEDISSPIYDDYAPVLHKGGLVFSTARQTKHEALPGGFSNPSTQNFLYECSIAADGKMSKPLVIKNDAAVMPTTNIAPFAITKDENFAVSTYNEYSNGIRHIHSASLSRLSMEMHLNMKTIEDFVPGDEFPHIGEHAASFPAFANNGKSIYFAMYGYKGGFGGFDIWVIHNENGKWTQPQNAGPDVNSAGDEICPSLASDGALYFSSDFHKGFGGFDVFRAKQSENGWKEVRNLGNSVNSSFDDMYFVYDASKKTGYFSSNRSRYYNIYNASMTGDISMMPLVNEKDADLIANNETIINNNSNSDNAANNENSNTVKNENIIAKAETATDNNSKVEISENGGFKPHNEVVTTTTIRSESNSEPKPESTVNKNTNSNNNATTVSNKPTVGNGNTVPCAMNFYIGGITDAETSRPVSGAIVYIKNLKSGVENKIKDPTNQYGEYSVILNPLCDYTIAISKAGFKNLVFDVNTGTGGKKTLLGNRAMLASATLARDKYNNIIEPEGPQVNTNPSIEELANPIVSSSKRFSHESNGMDIPAKGYMIQVIVAAKLSKEEQLKIGQFGNLFKEARGNKTAYRVGVFIDAGHLEASMKELKESYPDAFKVAVELDNDHLGGRIALSSQVVYPVTIKEVPLLEDKQKISDSPAEENQNTENLPEGTNSRGSNNDIDTNSEKIAFKIQLGAYQQADEISFSKISHLGLIEKEKKDNGLTYFYISGFNTLPEARNVRSKALEEGIIAPFIVAFKNGLQVNLSEVISE